MDQGKRVDPYLEEMLDESAASRDLVEAVFQLRSPGDAPAPTPDETEAIARDVIARAQKEAGATVDALNVFRNLGSFVVRAEPALVREIINAPEISTAVANRQPESAPAVEVDDEELLARVTRAVRQSGIAHPRKVHAVVAGGVVTLSGAVSSADERDDLETILSILPGVRSIENRLAVAAA
jgi:hypothetical protein